MIVRPEHIVERMVGQLVDRILLVRPSSKASCGTATWTYRAALIAGGILLQPLGCCRKLRCGNLAIAARSCCSRSG
jgi:hypothetical protein